MVGRYLCTMHPQDPLEGADGSQNSSSPTFFMFSWRYHGVLQFHHKMVSTSFHRALQQSSFGFSFKNGWKFEKPLAPPRGGWGPPKIFFVLWGVKPPYIPSLVNFVGFSWEWVGTLTGIHCVKSHKKIIFTSWMSQN